MRTPPGRLVFPTSRATRMPAQAAGAPTTRLDGNSFRLSGGVEHGSRSARGWDRSVLGRTPVWRVVDRARSVVEEVVDEGHEMDIAGRRHSGAASHRVRAGSGSDRHPDRYLRRRVAWRHGDSCARSDRKHVRDGDRCGWPLSDGRARGHLQADGGADGFRDGHAQRPGTAGRTDSHRQPADGTRLGGRDGDGHRGIAADQYRRLEPRRQYHVAPGGGTSSRRAQLDGAHDAGTGQQDDQRERRHAGRRSGQHDRRA